VRAASNDENDIMTLSTAVFEVLLLLAAIPVQVWAYKILLIPVPGKSHVFSMAAIAEGLANR